MLKSNRRRKKERAKATNNEAPVNSITFLGPGVVIEGTLRSDAPLRIDGRVNGEVKASEEVTIGKSGIVIGPIQGSRVIVAGEVVGDVTVTDYLHVLPSGRLEGTTHTPRLIVEEGALFKGKSEMAVSQHEPNLSIKHQPEETRQTPPDAKTKIQEKPRAVSG